MGFPTEIYLHGTYYSTKIVAMVIVSIVGSHVFLPVLVKLQLSCVNEYLELRFSKQVRKLVSIIYVIGNIAYISIVIYVPSSAFSQVTKYSIYHVAPFIVSVCIIYTGIVSFLLLQLFNILNNSTL